MHHKRRRARRQRATCKLCKPWKLTGATQDDLHSARARDTARHDTDGAIGALSCRGYGPRATTTSSFSQNT